MNKKALKQAVLNLYYEKVEVMSHSELTSFFDYVNIKTGINVFSLLNKGKPQNRYSINEYATGSGGRAMAQYKSGHAV